MKASVVLLRHTEVAVQWRGRCYGRTNVGLSRAGAAAARLLVDRFANEGFDAVVHSGLRRTRAIAEPLASRLGLVAICDEDWRERDFASWEGLNWNAIYRATGNAMDGMIDDPAGFRPGGGETTFEMRDRVVAAYRRLGGRVLVVTHGGPIAAVLGTATGAEVRDWPVGQCGLGQCFRINKVDVTGLVDHHIVM